MEFDGDSEMKIGRLTVVRKYDNEYYEKGIKKYIKLLTPYFLEDCTAIPICLVHGGGINVEVTVSAKKGTMFTFRQKYDDFELPNHVSEAEWRYRHYKYIYELVSHEGVITPLQDAKSVLAKFSNETTKPKTGLNEDIPDKAAKGEQALVTPLSDVTYNLNSAEEKLFERYGTSSGSETDDDEWKVPADMRERFCAKGPELIWHWLRSLVEHDNSVLDTPPTPKIDPAILAKIPISSDRLIESQVSFGLDLTGHKDVSGAIIKEDNKAVGKGLKKKKKTAEHQPPKIKGKKKKK